MSARERRPSPSGRRSDHRIALLNQLLADCIDLALQCKQAHWNVKGPHFIALHRLFDEIYDALMSYVDLIAERIVELGGIAEGIVAVVQQRSSLVQYSLTLPTTVEHVAALSNVLSSFGRSVRAGIDDMNDLSDAISADILTEVGRGTAQWLWFVEAHQPTTSKST
jgi:starvation-inducible DNA-binding protein